MVDQLNRVLVVGGGFSGTSTAIALRRQGIAVDLVERNPVWATDGAGISIGGAALRSLRALGVIEQFLEFGYANDGQDVRAANGDHLAQFPTPRLAGPEVPGNGAILRPLLGRILANAAEGLGARVHLGTTVTEYTDDGDGVDVDFSDGRSGRYDLIVAADGLYSQTRHRLFPAAAPPAFSGQGAWRAVLPRPADINRTTIWVGGEVKVGVNPISQTEMYLFVNESNPIVERLSDEELLHRLRALTATIPAPQVKAIRHFLDGESRVLYRPMDNLLLPLPWHRGRVVLIGDAVHATTPHLAAGAGIGIEDAIVLADELAENATIDAALTAFEARRFERCRMVVENSARLGVLEATEGGERDYVDVQSESLRLLALPI